MKLFDEKVHIYETSHNNLNKNKSAIKWLQRMKKVLTPKRTLSKKIGGMHEKGEFSKIKRSARNVLIETANTCNILPESAVHGGQVLFLLRLVFFYFSHRS